jgi:hypothetical protein
LPWLVLRESMTTCRLALQCTRVERSDSQLSERSFAIFRRFTKPWGGPLT